MGLIIYWDVSGKVLNRTQENHGESFIFLLTLDWVARLDSALEALQGRI